MSWIKERYATFRREARADVNLQAALVEWISTGWRSVASSADYLRQHGAGARSTAFGSLDKGGQTAVVRGLLEALVRNGKAERCVGPGDRPGTETTQYRTIRG